LPLPTLPEKEEPHMSHLNTIEAAKRLGVNPQTIRDWVRSGHLQAYRIGPNGQLRFKTEDIDQALHQARPAVEPAAK
jgi:excisionase family DNA binding protein